MTIDAKFHRSKVAHPGSVDTGANGDRINRSVLAIAGFSPSVLLNKARQRQVDWGRLRQQVPLMKLCPLGREAIEKANLPDSQRLLGLKH